MATSEVVISFTKEGATADDVESLYADLLDFVEAAKEEGYECSGRFTTGVGDEVRPIPDPTDETADTKDEGE